MKKGQKLHIKVGDQVQVIAGDEKGKTGVVQKIVTEKQRAFVEGLNMVTKHVKPTAENPEGGVQKKESSIHISNLAVIDPKSGETTKIGRKKDDSGKLKRYSKKTGEFIN